MLSDLKHVSDKTHVVAKPLKLETLLQGVRVGVNGVFSQ